MLRSREIWSKTVNKTIRQVYKLNKVKEAENLSDVSESKLMTEKELDKAVKRELLQEREEKKRLEAKTFEKSRREAFFLRMEELERLEEEWEKQECVTEKRRVDAEKRRDKNIALWNEKQKSILSSKISRAFKFSYFPLLIYDSVSSSSDEQSSSEDSSSSSDAMSISRQNSACTRAASTHKKKEEKEEESRQLRPTSQAETKRNKEWTNNTLRLKQKHRQPVERVGKQVTEVTWVKSPDVLNKTIFAPPLRQFAPAREKKRDTKLLTSATGEELTSLNTNSLKVSEFREALLKGISNRTQVKTRGTDYDKL